MIDIAFVAHPKPPHQTVGRGRSVLLKAVDSGRMDRKAAQKIARREGQG